ncbi:hypothetical protein JZ751_014507 [Albula glossodonta]|uniref:C2H2-type domain-containing protein n=1 Tax=Albula glossodonta TaxID=121402 RepID=A0A8T2MVL5_9TELE|nr:hypothetical protein JZ751_014507 [Albula glossodonta]
MPRSFLVKKYFSSKKPNYSDLEDPSDPVDLLERPPLAQLLAVAHSAPAGLEWKCTLLSVLPSPWGPLDLSPCGDSRSPEDKKPSSAPPSPEPGPQHQATLRCEVCLRQYGSLGALKMHIRSHTLPCVCSICGKAFSRAWLLRGHVRTHTGERPFSCSQCERAFADRSNLRAHQQTHAQMKRYHCAACPRSFSRMSLLNKHNRTSCSPAS